MPRHVTHTTKAEPDTPVPHTSVPDTPVPGLDLSEVGRIVDEINPNGNLIAVLQHVQAHYGYLPEPVVDEIARLSGVPASRIYGIVTFYAQFSTQPSGRHKVFVCHGTACHVAGAPLVLEAFSQELEIPVGETTTDGLFTLQTVNCVGACALAPVVRVGDDETHGRMTPDRARALVNDLKHRAEVDR